MFSSSVESWRALFAPVARDQGLPLDFVLAWLGPESNGNPCATGIPGVEAGLAQTYHPDDDRFGMTYSQLREGCSGQTLVVPLSQEQKQRRVDQVCNYIADRRDRAARALSDAGIDWSQGASDFWCVVKLHHALPAYFALLRGYVDTVGSAPSGWSEWRAWVESLSDDDVIGMAPSAAAWSSLAQRRRILDNAEGVGRYGGAESLFGFVSLDVAILVGIGVVLALGARLV